MKTEHPEVPPFCDGVSCFREAGEDWAGLGLSKRKKEGDAPRHERKVLALHAALLVGDEGLLKRPHALFSNEKRASLFFRHIPR